MKFDLNQDQQEIVLDALHAARERILRDYDAEDQVRYLTAIQEIEDMIGGPGVEPEP